MKISKQLLVAGAITTIGLASFAGVGAAHAQSGEGTTSLIEKIASKFNVDKSEVQAVFDEVKAEKEAERQSEMAERLQDAVDDGKISNEQKTLIEEKVKELEDKREATRDELKKWAEANNIPEKYLMMGGRRGNHMGGPRH